MDGREQRGLEIAATKRLRRKGDLWIVPATTGTGSYVVDPTPSGATCSCPDFETWGSKCKHVYAVQFTMQRETTTPDGTVTETVRMTYRQEWSAYNAAQTNEKERVAMLLRDLCSAIDNPIQKRGRPRLPLADTIFCAVMKVYGGVSGRRSMTDLRDFAAKGFIDRAPHYNQHLQCFGEPRAHADSLQNDRGKRESAQSTRIGLRNRLHRFLGSPTTSVGSAPSTGVR